MRKTIAILLTMTILCSLTVTAFAENSSAARSGDWLYTVEDGGAVITAYQGIDASVAVPGTLGDYPVVRIGRAAFCGSRLESVDLPSTVREIGWWAFYGASNLRNVSLPDGLQKIDFGAFMNCPSLHGVTIPSTVYEIGADAFAVRCETVTGVQDYPNDRLVSTQDYTVDDSFIVTGYSGTAAEDFAQAKQLSFDSKGELSFGDLNADGVIDAGDLILLRNYSDGGELTLTQRLSADLNCDGAVDGADSELLGEYVSGEISYYSLPAVKFAKPAGSFLYGRTMYCDGDSIAKGTGTDTFGSEFYSYCHYIGYNYGMDFVDKAVGGTTLARVKDNPITDSESILERVLQMKGDYDVILLDGGFNDMFLDVRIGTVTADNNRNGIYDEFSTAGAVERICWFLTKNYPDAVKLFVLCHEYDDDDHALRWDTIKKALDKWDIPYVDISGETDFTAVNKSINNQYFYCNDSKKTADRIHPLAYAQEKVYGRMVEKKLNDLFEQKYLLAFGEDSLSLAKGESVQTSLMMNGYSYFGEVSWTSSDSEVAAVENGTVTAKSVGEAFVRAETSDGRIARLRVDVKQNPLCLYLNRSAVSLNPFESSLLIPEFLEGTVSHTVTYTSSDPNVAEVYADGSVIARSRGSAVITCKLPNGVKTACDVIVQ
ncbi:MAG: leucine-rich repeat protein [Ruminococcus sp.]